MARIRLPRHRHETPRIQVGVPERPDAAIPGHPAWAALARRLLGVGYSSFGYLRQFPIDILKIDRSFIAGLPENATDRVLVEAIINLARSLGVEAIAEGVETVARAELLARLGCCAAQGFLWSNPVPADRFVAVALRHAA